MVGKEKREAVRHGSAVPQEPEAQEEASQAKQIHCAEYAQPRAVRPSRADRGRAKPQARMLHTHTNREGTVIDPEAALRCDMPAKHEQQEASDKGGEASAKQQPSK